MDARNYLIRLGLYAIFACAVVVGCNYFIDPYGITGAPRLAGLNEQKADINDYARQFKKYQPLLVNVDTLIVGNSRAEMGVDPAHDCFVQKDWQVYNLAMPGAGVRMQLNYALNVLYAQPVKRVYLSVDFIDFIDNGPQHQQREPFMHQATGELRYLPDGTPNPEYLELKFKDYARALFSLDALVSSLKTVLGQGQFAPDRTVRGFNPARDLAGIVRVEGARALYDQKMENLQRKYAQGWYLRDPQGWLHPAFDDLDEFLAQATARDVEVVVFTHPFHASYWDLMAETSLLPQYEQWLESVTTLLRRHSDSVRAFWDFSADTRFTSEEIPGVGQRNNALRWFWEPAHYRSELGDKMVSRMLGPGCPDQDSFGRRLL